MGATLRFSFLILGACAFGFVAMTAETPRPALAAASPSASPPAATDDAMATKDGGTIDGHIDSIDYKTGLMVVDAGEGPSKKSYDVLVVPGTNILGQKTFHTIADLKKGGHVQVLVSRHGSTNTAQIIRLL